MEFREFVGKLNEKHPVPEGKEMEARLIPALRYDGELFEGEFTHGDAEEALETAHPGYDAEKLEVGFVTSEGKFITRKEADSLH